MQQLILSLALLPAAAAFTTPMPHSRMSPLMMSQSVLEMDTEGQDSVKILDALPLAADYGFDPLGLSKVDFFAAGAEDKARASEIVLRDYRDAELRHGRLAMLAALAWPVQELLSPSIARIANRAFGNPGLSDLLTETSGRSPNVLNGGLEQGTVPAFLLGVAIGIGAIDSVSLSLKDKMKDRFVPGDFGFDPLRLMKGASPEAVRDMQEKEINNGRLAMMAVLAFVIEEAVTGLPVVQVTPALFHPLWENPAVMQFMDSAYDVSSAAQRLPAEDVASLFQ